MVIVPKNARKCYLDLIYFRQMLPAFLKRAIPGLLLSAISSAVFIGGILMIAGNHFLSHNPQIGFLLFLIPVLLYGFCKKTTSPEDIFLSNMLTTLWLVLPLCLMIGWFFSSAAFFDSETKQPFNIFNFFLFSSIFFIPFVVSTFTTLLIGNSLKRFLLKRKILH